MGTFKKIINNHFFQSILLGGIITTAFILIWDAPIKKYKIEIDPFELIGSQQNYWYSGDFDGDGDSERIRCYTENENGSLGIVHYDKDGFITDNFHFSESEWNYALKPGLFDINNDGVQELLYFSIRNDSIFLNAFNLREFRLLIDHHFFNVFERKSDLYAFRAGFISFKQKTEDRSELMFYFDAGFGLYPRGVFKIVFPSLEFISSPTEYIPLVPEFEHDLDGDGSAEIFCHNYSPSNAEVAKKYPDSLSYIVVLDQNLQFKFEPIRFSNQFSSVRCIPDMENDSIFYVFYLSRSKDDFPFQVLVLNQFGEICKSKKYDLKTNLENINGELRLINNKSYICINNVGTFQLTPDLDQLPLKIEANLNEKDRVPFICDLDNDGFSEWIYVSNKSEITIYNEDSNEKMTFESPLRIERNIAVMPYMRNNVIEKYMIDTGSGFFFFSYFQNPLFYLLYLTYAGIFSIVSLLIYMVLVFQKRTIEKKWNIEKQLSELQFNSVKSQLNPHFLFNALNSVALMINEGKAEEAYDFLTVNSRMIQRVMDDAHLTTRSLKNEIQFTKDYVNIQSRRFKDRFKFQLDVSAGVDQNFNVPKMCIHTYVENSIKHGFRNTISGGNIFIRITNEKQGIKILIADNGMGRAIASRYHDSSGNGIRIMDEFYQLFEKYQGYKIQCSINDCNPEYPTLQGTVVELKIQKNN